MAKSQPINAPLSASKSRPLSGWRANWRYYYEMTKPRVVMLLLLMNYTGGRQHTQYTQLRRLKANRNLS